MDNTGLKLCGCSDDRLPVLYRLMNVKLTMTPIPMTSELVIDSDQVNLHFDLYEIKRLT